MLIQRKPQGLAWWAGYLTSKQASDLVATFDDASRARSDVSDVKPGLNKRNEGNRD